MSDSPAADESASVTDSAPAAAAAGRGPQAKRGRFGLSEQEGERIFEQPGFKRWALVLVLASFIILALQYLRSDLWFDEILTLRDYGQASSFGRVFSTYNVANNHILYSAILWLWLHVVNANGEEILRFPCLVMGVLTLWLLFSQGQVLFDRAAGFMMAVLMAFSPVYLGFFWQMRGYGLGVLLATLATFGALYILQGKGTRGLIMFGVGVLLLPGAVPSNLLVSISLWLYMVVVLVQRRALARWFGHLLVAGVCVAGGMAIYLPILNKFLKVARETDGWDSGWKVAVHWLVALAIHLGVFMVACYALGGTWRQNGAVGAAGGGGAARSRSREGLYATLPTLWVCCLVPILVVALWRAPFPRSFIAYLGPFTVASLVFFRRDFVVRNTWFLILIFLMLCNTLVAYRVTDYTTSRRLLAGEVPQDLVQQFYSRNHDISSTVFFLQNAPQFNRQVRVFVGFHYFPALDTYWSVRGMPSEQVECLNGGKLFPLKLRPDQYRWLPKVILAYNEDEARRLYRLTFGTEPHLRALESPTPMTLYWVEPELPPGSTPNGNFMPELPPWMVPGPGQSAPTPPGGTPIPPRLPESDDSRTKAI